MNEFESRDIRDEIDEYIDGRGNNMSREYFEMQNRLNQALEEERKQANLDEKNFNQRVSNQKLMDMYDNAHHNDNVTQKKLENDFRNAHQNDLVTYNKLRKSNPQLANDHLNAFNRSNSKDLNKLQRSRDILNKQRPQKMSNMDKALSEALDKAGTKGKLAKAFLKTKTGKKALEKVKKSNPILNNLDKLGNNSEDRNSSSDQNSNGGFGSIGIEISPKIIKMIAILAPCIMVVMFMCLFLSASHTYIKSIGLGSADSLGDEDAQSKIEEKINQTIEDQDELYEEATPEELNSQDSSSISFIIDRNSDFRKNKLQSSNLVQIANSKYIKRKYNEADLDKLEDFFPSLNNLDKKYDEGLAYDFFYKMYNIYSTYRDQYDVYLDLPLLMSTLMIQSDDMNVIFDSNLTSSEKKPDTKNKPIIKYEDDLSWYKSTKSNSQYDMQLLAKNMVSKQIKVTCFDSNGKETDTKILKDDEIGTEDKACKSGESYETEDLGLQKDDEKYKEFLKKFLEEKYYINEDNGISNGPVTGSGSIDFSDSYSDGNATATSIYEVSSEPDPSMSINYWSHVNSSDFVYPKDDSTGKSLGAWPKNYKQIPSQLNNPKTYNGGFIWPVTPPEGTYSTVYEHLGMDIMAYFGTPIYSPTDAILVYSEWGHTSNKGSDETAYSVTLELEKPVNFAGVNIGHIFMTHMSGIRYRCEWGKCNRKVKKGELLGFVGNAAGTALSGGWAPHLHITYYPYNDYSGGLYTKNMEKLYNIKSGTKRKAGE